MKRNKTPAPITKGVAKKVPIIMQLEALECGAACLAMISGYYKKWVPLEQVRLDCGVSRDGSNARNILVAARSYGFVAKGYRYEIDELKENGIFPCIIHWNFSHFVVLRGFKGDKAYINDPANGAMTISMKQFDEAFTGVCLFITPDENFVSEGKPRSIFSYAKKHLVGTASAVVAIMLLTVATSLLSLASPTFDRFFIDYLLSKSFPAWVNYFFIYLAIFDGIVLIANILETSLSYRVNARFNASSTSKFMKKIFALPMDFYSQRESGDLLQRKDSAASLSYTFINLFVPLIFNVIFIIIYFTSMITYSWILSLIGVCACTLNLLFSRVVAKKRENISRLNARDSAKLFSISLAGIEMIETIKANGAERGFFKRFSGYQATASNNSLRYIKIDAIISAVGSFFTEMANILVMVIGVYLVIAGQFTIGMVMAFQGLLGSFMGPAIELINSTLTIQKMKVEMERVSDVLEHEEYHPFSNDKKDQGIALKGNIDVKNVDFGYAKLQEPFLKNISFSIHKGECVSIVGESGCGKSTIAKLLCGLYQQKSGSIQYDGRALKQISKKSFANAVGIVNQDIVLFEDTIKNNIAMFDDKRSMKAIIAAARDAQIHKDIMERPGGYDFVLKENGNDFSGGQRQRFEIARVLAQNPKILILDEATSTLDAETEYKVIKAIKKRNITLIIIAHRLSTIVDSDKIIVLDKGSIVAQGKHNELMSMCPRYKELVQNN